jgi:hypothetical protein
MLIAGCLNEDNRIPPNCYDGILNNGEERLDCGGEFCDECDHCTNGVYEPERLETWVDCGGECGPCPQNANGIQDGDETGIDCGGSAGGCELLCGDGLLNGNEDQIDCEDDVANVEESCPHCPTCIDGSMNGNEVGIDCGGDCAACCSSGNCTNGIIDGNEFWTDCGGRTCPDCADTLKWSVGGEFEYSPSSVLENTVTHVQATDGTPPGELRVTLSAGVLGSSPGGTMTIVMTEPAVGWLPNQLFTPDMDNSLLYVITYTTIEGETYSSQYEGSECALKLLKYATINVPASTTDGCNKPAGDYVFYRVIFNGTLVNDTDATSTIEIDAGLLQFTFLP